MSDSYIEKQQEIIEVCKMVINNGHVFSAKEILKAEKLMDEAKEKIREQEKILSGSY